MNIDIDLRCSSCGTKLVNDGYYTVKPCEHCHKHNLVRHYYNRNFPTVVCLCGSTRFSEEFKKQNLLETIKGNIVLSIGCDTKSDSDLIALGKLTEEAKQKLDELHKRKIDLADEIFVLDVDGYIGSSTRSEIEYAKNIGRRIRYLSSEQSK